MHVFSDNSGFFVIGYYSGSNPKNPMMWKLLFSSASSAQWYTISNMHYSAYGQLMLEDNKFYLVTYTTIPYVAYFSKVIVKYLVETHLIKKIFIIFLVSIGILILYRCIIWF